MDVNIPSSVSKVQNMLFMLSTMLAKHYHHLGNNPFFTARKNATSPRTIT